MKLTLGLKQQVCLLLSLGLSRRQAATVLDLDHSTITHSAERDEDFARSLVRAEELSQIQPLMHVAAAGLKDWRAAAWLLAHRQKAPTRLTPEHEAELHQANLKHTRRHSELRELDDILSEQRNEAREQREKGRKERRVAEKQAQFEAENPELFRKRKRKEPQPDSTE